jgi:hypothetical protein
MFIKLIVLNYNFKILKLMPEFLSPSIFTYPISTSVSINDSMEFRHSIYLIEVFRTLARELLAVMERSCEEYGRFT